MKTLYTQKHAQQEITYVCEICGTEVLESQTQSIHTVYAMPGIPGMGSFSAGDHYACSTEHVKRLALAQLDYILEQREKKG